LKKTLKNINYYPEGPYAIEKVMMIKKEKEIETPLIDMLWKILNNKISPEKAIEKYMALEKS
jgi:glycerol-3-phosphate dehydrogenase